MEEITKIESIDQYDQLFGLETLHPLVNVIDFSKATKTVDYYRMNIGFYSLFLKDAKCGDLRYGRKYYDYQEGTVVCMAPGQVIGIDNRKQTPIRTKSIGLLFHPDLIRGTSLGQNIKHYSFFSYEVNEALHLSEQEREIVTDCIHKIQIELEHAIERAVILSGSTLLTAEDFNLRNRQSQEAVSERERYNIERMEKENINEVLRICGGNITLAAEMLGITRTSLYRRIEKFKL